MSKFPSTIITYGIAVFTLCIGLLFFIVIHGEPIHDLNIWLLDRNFYTADISHPATSTLLEKKKYLGGPSWHGGNRCIYAVGEVRITSLSKDEIRRAYQHANVRFWGSALPLHIIFTDEHDGPYTLPYTDWQDELLWRDSDPTEWTTYLVYASTQKKILLSDYRCDD